MHTHLPLHDYVKSQPWSIQQSNVGRVRGHFERLHLEGDIRRCIPARRCSSPPAPPPPKDDSSDSQSEGSMSSTDNDDAQSDESDYVHVCARSSETVFFLATHRTMFNASRSRTAS